MRNDTKNNNSSHKIGIPAQIEDQSTYLNMNSKRFQYSENYTSFYSLDLDCSKGFVFPPSNPKNKNYKLCLN